jgi:hypothetical protein
MTLEQARTKAIQRSRNGGTWIVIKEDSSYKALPYSSDLEPLAKFFAGKEQKIIESTPELPES